MMSELSVDEVVKIISVAVKNISRKDRIFAYLDFVILAIDSSKKISSAFWDIVAGMKNSDPDMSFVEQMGRVFVTSTHTPQIPL